MILIKKEIENRKEALRAQNAEEGATVPSMVTTPDDVNNINQLRTIVDESDKLYYDGLKLEQETLEREKLEQEKLSSEEPVLSNSTDAKDATEPLESINNFNNRFLILPKNYFGINNVDGL